MRKRSVVKVTYDCGSAFDETNRERLKKLARGILRRLSPEEIGVTAKRMASATIV